MAVRTQYEDYFEKSERDPKTHPPLSARIYPGNYASVVHQPNEKKQISLMRYTLDPPFPDASKYTSYNARKDNLTSKFWSEAFMINHGILVVEAFYEWVEVKDLLEAGVVKFEEVKGEFERQAEARKKKILDAGKKYKPTPTETKDPHFRKIIIEFKPDREDLLVPVIFSVTKERMGFAIVTDEPLPDVKAAGHERTPIFLAFEAVDDWLTPKGRATNEVMKILDLRVEKPSFSHGLPDQAA